MNNDLVTYVMDHTCGTEDEGADVIFFKVKPIENPSKVALYELIKATNGEFCECNPFDGKEHNYLELGGWLGDQGVALRFMGLGAELGMWDLLTPRSLFGNVLSEDMVKQMAGAGMIAIQYREGHQHKG